VQLLDAGPEFWGHGHGEMKKVKHPQLTIALTDPDAPSRENPESSEVCHWLATGIEVVDPSAAVSGAKMEVLMPYKPPGPPPKTGKHRYVFVALAPRNGTLERLHLNEPGERRHWGYGGKERVGVRRWAEEEGLVVVGELLGCWECPWGMLANGQ
jgi:hypothetical protein